MTVALDFGALPPEINSGRMYSGPGATPMLAAAATWNTLAADLGATAASYQSVILALTEGPWRGPASTSMAQAAAPHTAWLNTTATQAGQTATQAAAAAAAYEAAFAMTVPPPVIAANRSLLMSLVATNVLGQNTAAIAATEARYAEMWAQDAAAMYDYAGSSAAASAVTPFTAPAQTTNPSGLAAQSAAVAQATGTAAGTQQATLSQLVSTVPAALSSLSAPGSSTSTSGLGGILSGLDGSGSSSSGLMGIVDTLAGNGSGSGFSEIFNDLFSSNGLGLNANLWNTIFSSGFYTPANTLGAFTGLFGGAAAADVAGDVASEAAAAGDAAGAAAGGLGDAAGGLGGLGGLGSAISADVGRAASIGPLLVPPSWTAISPATSPIASALGATPLSAPAAGVPGMPGMPMTGMVGNGAGRAVPQYGFKPTVVAHPPAAG